MNIAGLNILPDLVRSDTMSTGDNRENCFFLQRLATAIQPFNRLIDFSRNSTARVGTGKTRTSHLQIPGGPKMARAALSRRAIDGPHVSKLT